MRSPNATYLPAVDHLRAFAALLIVYYHGFLLLQSRILYNTEFNPAHIPNTRNPLLSLVVEGHTAVALFMVLSGFIFTHVALGKRVLYGPFMRNRLLRIYPLFLVLIAFGIYLTPEKFFLGSLAQTLLPLGRLRGALDLGDISAMFWTIAVEFQFYLIFPFLIGFLNRDGRRPLLLILAATISLRLVAVAMDGNVRDLSYWTIVGRIDQFLIGMLAAAWLRQRTSPEKVGRFFPAAALFSVFAIFIFHRAGGNASPAAWKAIWPTLEGLVWAAFIVTYIPFATRLPQLVSKGLARVGEVSYSMYLLHYLLISIVSKNGWILPIGGDVFTQVFSTITLLVLPLVVGSSMLSFRAIEEPFLKLRVRYFGES